MYNNLLYLKIVNMSTNKFIEKCILIHNDTYNYNEVVYVKAKTLVLITCKIHGVFEQLPDVHLRGGGCPMCGYITRAVTRKNNNKWLPFIEAREYVHKLRFNSITEWNKWCKYNKAPNISASPKITYKNEWKGWGDWLGNKINWLSFEECKKIVHTYNLRSCEDWKFFCTELKLKPDNIPYEPNKIYKEQWISWGDWLGFSSRANGNLSGFIYVIQQSNLPNNVYKIGRTYRLDKRIYEHKRLHNTDITILKTYPVDNMKLSEERAHVEVLKTESPFKYLHHKEYFEIFDINNIIVRLDNLFIP